MKIQNFLISIFQAKNLSDANLKDVTEDLQTPAIGKNTVMFTLATNLITAKYEVATSPILTHQVLENI